MERKMVTPLEQISWAYNEVIKDLNVLGEDVATCFPWDMRLKRLVDAHSEIKRLEDIVRIEIIREAIKEGWTGFVDYDPEIADELERY